MKFPAIILSASCIFISFSLNTYAQFNPRVDSGKVEYNGINEASGIAASRQNPGVLWINNDSGDKNRIYALNESGEHLGVYYLDGCAARDWEDIASGPGPDSNKMYVYVGNIGDNNAAYATKVVYRCPEPVLSTQQQPKTDTIRGIDILEYAYPDGPRDAEALMVDPQTKDYYIVSKRETLVRVYRAKYPQPTNSVDTLECIDTLTMRSISGASISSFGTEILIKNYDKVFYWQRKAGETVREAMARAPIEVAYTKEPQGEAICWAYSGEGYFTVSEEKDDIQCHLYYYARSPTGIVLGKDNHHSKNSRVSMELYKAGLMQHSPQLQPVYNVQGQVITSGARIRKNYGVFIYQSDK